MTDRALEGLRVVEFTDEIGSYCGRLLADLGAEVIKIEPPGGGQERHTPPFYKAAGEGPNTSIAFWVHNTSKKSVVLDLEKDGDREQARKLALRADVVLEDNPVGWMAERGLGYEQLRSANPKLVYASVTGFGQTGPRSHWAYDDIIGQAMGGIMTLAGEPADPPNLIYGNQANLSASIQAAQGIMLAVLSADQTGEGQLVDVSAQEAVQISQETAMQTWDLQKKNRARTGERGMIPLQLPATGIYKCSDGGYVFSFILAPAGGDLPDLVAWMKEKGMEGDLEQEPYATVVQKLNMAYITQAMGDPSNAASMIPALMHTNEVIAAFFASMTARQAYEEGQGRRLLIGLVSTPKDLAENTQLRGRDWFTNLDFDYLNATIEFPGPPYRLSETPAQIAPPPALGQHTEEVLASLK